MNGLSGPARWSLSCGQLAAREGDPECVEGEIPRFIHRLLPRPVGSTLGTAGTGTSARLIDRGLQATGRPHDPPRGDPDVR